MQWKLNFSIEIQVTFECKIIVLRINTMLKSLLKLYYKHRNCG